MPSELIPWISTDPVHQQDQLSAFTYIHFRLTHTKLCIGYFFTRILRQKTKSSHFSLFS